MSTLPPSPQSCLNPLVHTAGFCFVRGGKGKSGLGKTQREKVESAGLSSTGKMGWVCDCATRRVTDKTLLSFVCLFICVLIVSHVRLGKIVAQSRIAVPEINGETLSMSRVALRFKWQNMTGFSLLHGTSRTLAPGTESLRSTQGQPRRSSQGRPWRLAFPPSGLALVDVESRNGEGRSRRERRTGTAAHRSICGAEVRHHLGEIWMANL